MNMRNQTGSSDYRLVARSADGGATWDTVFTDYALPDPVCQGAVLNVGTASNPNILAFSNPADTTYRRNLTLRISYDGGKTWSENYLVDEKDAYTMYSDIVEVKPNHIGVLYEQEGYKEIAFRVIEWGRSN